MRYILIVIGIALLVASCNSNKSKEEAKPITNQDTITGKAPDSANNNLSKDTTVVKETEWKSIGELSLGLSQPTITGLLGQPDSKSKAEKWDADGLIHQDWLYQSRGIMVNMESDNTHGDPNIFSITITSPCGFRTKKNMGIGSTYKEVMAAYENDIDKSFTDKNSITVGSVYGGIIFSFKNDKAEKIFIGAAAE